MITINIAKDFSDTPGARFIKEGDYSGELFRKELLEPKFKEAIEKNQKLVIDLDGGYGYPTSFLEEAFGGLARIYDKKQILENIEFISQDEPILVEEIKEYINNAQK